MFLNYQEDFFKDQSDYQYMFGQELSSEVDLFEIRHTGNTQSQTGTEKNPFIEPGDPGIFVQESDKKPNLSEISNFHAPILAEEDLFSETEHLLKILRKEVGLCPIEVYLDNKTGQIMIKNKSVEGLDSESVLQPDSPQEPQAEAVKSEENSSSLCFNRRVRFSKKHDREMFSILRELCDTHCVPLSNFCSVREPLVESAQLVMDKLSEEIKWRKSRKKDLLKRICKYVNDPTFSLRDARLLRELVKSQKQKGAIDFTSLLYYFPGKTAQQLEYQYSKSKDRKRTRISNLL
ncbi:unnamed protein product [Moneuplotes crassus]|uniref:Uncharacterized protein n=1 Tax=Euplotes crassus TaxID=5936 RepID=A0AAD2D8I2_EUPCR|nr:unnamed protein product [Moneuplotes crassus]